MNKNRVNGSGKQASQFDGKEIEFPVTYQLKAVMTGVEERNKKDIIDVFTQLEIDYKYLEKKISSKNSYTSYSFQVTLNTREKMLELYSELKKIKALKFAV